MAPTIAKKVLQHNLLAYVSRIARYGRPADLQGFDGDDESSSAIMNPARLQSRQIDLLIFGEAKREVLDRAVAGDDILEMLVRAELRQTRAPETVWWAP